MYNRYYRDYPSDYNYNMSALNQGIAVLIAIAGIVAIAFIAMYVLNSIALMKIFKKAGIEGWKAWVPIYSTMIFYELGGMKSWPVWATALSSIFLAVPLLNILAWPVAIVVGSINTFFGMIANFSISKKFGKDINFAMLSAIPIANIVWLMMLAFGDNTWNDSLGEPSLAKGTILGYKVVEEEPAEAEVAKESTEKTE